MEFRGFYESHDDSGTLQIWWFVQCACIADSCSDSDACYCGFCMYNKRQMRLQSV